MNLNEFEKMKDRLKSLSKEEKIDIMRALVRDDFRRIDEEPIPDDIKITWKEGLKNYEWLMNVFLE